MDKVLQLVRDFAALAHGGQMRKYTPEPYIVHPVRVMELCAVYGATRAQLAAALLHDVLEDTRVDEEEMLRFLRSVMEEQEALHTLRVVVDLTDVYTSAAYPQWKRRRRKDAETERMATIHPEAQTVKYADIIDNAREIVLQDPHFAPKFLFECRQLLRVMNQGEPILWQRAKTLVRNALDAVASGKPTEHGNRERPLPEQNRPAPDSGDRPE